MSLASIPSRSRATTSARRARRRSRSSRSRWPTGSRTSRRRWPVASTSTASRHASPFSSMSTTTSSRRSRSSAPGGGCRSEEHTSELQSRLHLVCRLLLEKKKKKHNRQSMQQRTYSTLIKNQKIRNIRAYKIQEVTSEDNYQHETQEDKKRYHTM